ncbi:hypothetical protein Y5S_02579 [Alcanivorax nanhaiticus]|uniref:Uncharacterized protein n=1 Tax=Alcanivorax nanhaiticus TaxID=1177154 RepID=A0A095SI79_9GAMM|nr:conjugal transfer protein TraF [Alcanivorax nanhaiticus]KGD64277.1 hypothetical protein Y5S_02579 [Alcanivorax nanhaiticus]
MKQFKVLGVAALLAPVSAMAVQSYDARAMARGGVGLTMGEYNQALLNPALMNEFDEKDNFAFSLNVGVLASDKDNMLDDLDEAGDELDDLEDNNGDADRADALLQSMSGKLLQVDAGAAVMVGIPNQRLPLAVVVKSTAQIGATAIYNPADSAILNQQPFDQDDLLSEVHASGIETRELGLMMGFKPSEGFIAGTDLGATVKYQKVTLVNDVQRVGNFESDDVLDSENTKDKSTLNIDLGANRKFGEAGQYRVAGTIENLIPQTVDGTNGEDYSMAPVLTVGAGYHSTFFKAEADLDLSKRRGYGLVGDSQFASVGAELSAGRHAHLRVGYRADMKNEVSDIFTAGIGFTPFDTFSLDLAATKGEGETFGAALGLGLKF